MNQSSTTINLFKVFILIKNYFYSFLIAPIFVLAGYYFYATSYKEDRFISSTKILPEVSHRPNNGLAGIYIVAKSFSKGKELYSLEITPPALYSDILKSDDFYQYVRSSAPTLNKSFNITKKQFYALIIINLEKSGLSTIRTQGKTPNLANELNILAVDFLIDYLKKYRTQKARSDLEYLKNVEIGNDSIHEDLVNQLRLLLQDQTPVFTVLDRNAIQKEEKHSLGSYLALLFLTEIVILSYYLLKDKNYLSVLERTAEIKP